MSSNNDEQRRTAARNVEQAMMKAGASTMQSIEDLCAKDPLIRFIRDGFEMFVPGISSVGLLQATIAGTTVLVGPVHSELITAVRDDGTQSSWAQPAGDFFMFVSGPGQFKSGTMNLALEGVVHSTLRAVDGLKSSLGGLVPVHRWVDHIDRDLSIFRDGSTSAWFDRIKANPKLLTLAYFADEIDVVLKRVKSDKSSGELAAWLGLWNVGGPLCKNTGQINVGIHHVFSVAMACGQYYAAYDLGADEDSGGRGFAPRWIFAAGHLETRKWPFAKDVDYAKLLLARMVSGLGNLDRARDSLAPGTAEYLQNHLSQLAAATLVMLHTFPEATVRHLEPAQRIMRQKLNEARAARERPNEGATSRFPSSPVTPSRPYSIAAGMSTPQIAVRLGYEPEDSPQSTSTSSGPSSQSPDTNGKRKSGRDNDSDRGKPKPNPPTKDESQATWNAKSIRLYFTSEAQDLMANFLTTMEAKERESSRSPGQQALAAYHRKAKDHVMRLLPVVHLLHLGLDLLRQSGFQASHPLRPRHLLRLIEVATALPHVENRYVALGSSEEVELTTQSSQDSTDSADKYSTGRVGHLIGGAAVNTTLFIITEHLKLVSAIHAVSQSRCAPLLNMPGFFVTSTDAHANLNVSVDGFLELGKMAQRAGAGVLVAVDPVKWKTSKVQPFCVGADLTKTGGHTMHVFVKLVVPEDDGAGAKLKLSAALVRCGSSLAQFKASLTQNFVDGGGTGGAVPKATMTRMQQLPKLLLSMAFVAKRTDLVVPRDDDLSWADVVQGIQEDASKPSFWADEARLREAHMHLYQLATMVYNQKSMKDKDMPALQALARPTIPPPIGAAAEDDPPALDVVNEEPSDAAAVSTSAGE